MIIRFAFILLLTAFSYVCGWEEFGLRVPDDAQPSAKRKRRMSSIWDEARTRRQRIYKIREELASESSLQYESFIEMAPLSLSMSMIPSSGPTTSPVHSEPPQLVIPTASPTFSGLSSEPTSIPTAVPSDEPTASPVHVEPPAVVIPTHVPSDEPTTSPVHVEPPPPMSPTEVPSDEPTTSPVHVEPPPLVIPTEVPSDVPTTSPVHAEPPPLVIPTEIPSDEPTTSPVHAEPPPLLIPTQIPSDEPTTSPIHVEPPPLVVPTTVPSDEPTAFQITPTPSIAPTIQTHELSMEPSETPQPTAPNVAQPTSGEPTLTPSETPSQKPSHSPSPTLSQSPTTSTIPSIRPSTSRVPTLSPSLAPSGKPSVSILPTMSTRPSSSGVPSSQPSISSVPTRTANPTLVSSSVPSGQSQAAPTLAFDCVENDISLGEATDENTTGITLVVGYHVESSSNSTDDFLADLEQSLLLTAVAAALGCNRPDLQRRRLIKAPSRRLLQSSTIVDSVPCNTTVEGAVSCTTVETDLVFFMKGEVDPDRAAFSGYSAIRDKMSNDEYIGKIPTVLKLIYKSPLPLPAPPQVIEDTGTNNEDNPSLNARDAKLSVSSWTIGACVASVFGGAVSLMVWSRNRRSRHLRHVQLVEDCSMMETTSRNPVSV